MKMKKGTKRKQPLNSSSSSSITKSLKRSKTIDIGNTEPYPDHPRPTPDECLAVRDALLALHGFPKEFLRYREQRLKKENPSFEKNSLKPELLEKLDVEEKSDSSGKSEGEESVLDGLVSTILSQNTTDVNSQRAFLSLKSAFPTWEDVLAAEPNHIEDAIRCGGLAPTKASCIKSILNCLFEKRGKLCLEYLRDLSIGEVKAELSQFKGIGPKTVACVLMFHLQQNDFPVDTHARIKIMDQNSSISFLLSPTRRCVDYFSCDTPVDNKRLKLFGFEIDSCQKSTTAPRSERDESVSSSDTVLAKANKNLPGKGCISVDSSKVVHSRTDELPKGAGNPVCSIELQKYKCEFCSKKFTNSQAFGGHQNAHRKERLMKKGIQLQAKRAGSNAKILSFSD